MPDPQQSILDKADAYEAGLSPTVKPGVRKPTPHSVLDQADNVEYSSRLQRVNERFAQQFGKPITVSGLDTPMHRRGHRENFTSDVRSSDLTPTQRKALQNIGDEEGVKFDDYTSDWKQRGFTGPHLHGQMKEHYVAPSALQSPLTVPKIGLGKMAAMPSESAEAAPVVDFNAARINPIGDIANAITPPLSPYRQRATAIQNAPEVNYRAKARTLHAPPQKPFIAPHVSSITGKPIDALPTSEPMTVGEQLTALKAGQERDHIVNRIASDLYNIPGVAATEIAESPGKIARGIGLIGGNAPAARALAKIGQESQEGVKKAARGVGITPDAQGLVYDVSRFAGAAPRYMVPGGAVVSGAADFASSQYDDAMAHLTSQGMTPEQADAIALKDARIAALPGAVLGALRLKWLHSPVGQAGLGAGMAATSNVIARDYDPQRPLLQGAPESAAHMALGGLAMSGINAGVHGRMPVEGVENETRPEIRQAQAEEANRPVQDSNGRSLRPAEPPVDIQHPEAQWPDAGGIAPPTRPVLMPPIVRRGGEIVEQPVERPPIVQPGNQRAETVGARPDPADAGRHGVGESGTEPDRLSSRPVVLPRPEPTVSGETEAITAAPPRVPPQTETEGEAVHPEVRQWAGDSKILVNPEEGKLKKGEPVVVRGYHGTDKAFDNFDPYAESQHYEGSHPFVFFSSDQAKAKYYAGEGSNARVVSAYVSLKNPYVETIRGKLSPEAHFDSEWVTEDYGIPDGYDGIVIQNADTGKKLIIVSDTNQIKPEPLRPPTPVPSAEPTRVQAEQVLPDVQAATATKTEPSAPIVRDTATIEAEGAPLAQRLRDIKRELKPLESQMDALIAQRSGVGAASDEQVAALHKGRAKADVLKDLDARYDELGKKAFPLFDERESLEGKITGLEQEMRQATTAESHTEQPRVKESAQTEEVSTPDVESPAIPVEHHAQVQSRADDGTFNGPPSDAYVPVGERAERSLPKTLEEGGLPGGTNRTYEVKTHEATLARANEIIAEKGVQGAAEWLKGEKEPSAEHTATGLRVISELQKTGKFDEANDVANHLVDALTKNGQAVDAVKILNLLSPERSLLIAQRQAKKYGTKVNGQAITEKATVAQADDVRLTHLESEVERLKGELVAKGAKKPQAKGLTGRLSIRASSALEKLTAAGRYTPPSATPEQQSILMKYRSKIGASGVDQMAKEAYGKRVVDLNGREAGEFLSRLQDEASRRGVRVKTTGDDYAPEFSQYIVDNGGIAMGKEGRGEQRRFKEGIRRPGVFSEKGMPWDDLEVQARVDGYLGEHESLESALDQLSRGEKIYMQEARLRQGEDDAESLWQQHQDEAMSREGDIPDLSWFDEMSNPERGAVRIAGVGPLGGDAELLAEYGASQLNRTMEDFNSHMRAQFGDIPDAQLKEIARRAYDIRSEERVNELAERMASGDVKAKRSAGAEIAQSIKESEKAERLATDEANRTARLAKMEAEKAAKKAAQEDAMWARQERDAQRQVDLSRRRASESAEERGDIAISRRIELEQKAEEAQRKREEIAQKRQAAKEALVRAKAEREANVAERKALADESRQRTKDAKREGIDAKREADRLERTEAVTRRKEAAKAAQWTTPFKVEADEARNRKTADAPMSLEDATAVAADIIAPETPQESVRKGLTAAGAYRRIVTETGIEPMEARRAYKAAYQRVMDAKEAANMVAKIRAASTTETYTIDANGNRVKGPKATATLTEQQLQAAMMQKARAERQANQSKQDLAAEFQKLQMTTPQRVAYNLVRGMRQVLLSGITGTVETLGAFGALEQVLRVGRDAIGSGYKAIAPRDSYLGKMMAGAPREGSGFNVRAQVAGQAKFLRTWIETFTPGESEVRRYLKTGHATIDDLFGKHDSLPPEVTELFGRLHGGIKTPVRLAEFEVSTRIRLERAIDMGLDPTDPVVVLTAMEGAYLDANRGIMLGDNMLSDMFTSAKNSLRTGRKGGKPHPYAAMGIEALNPISKIPFNIPAEGARYIGGAPKALAETLWHGMRGTIEGLPEAEKERIVGNLKKGTLGAMVLGATFAKLVQFGGHKKPGEKDEDLEMEPESIKILGYEIPFSKTMGHSPLIHGMQTVATFRRVLDTYGFTDAMLTTAKQGAEHLPYIGSTNEALEAFGGENQWMNFAGRFLRARLIQPDVQKYARISDQPDTTTGDKAKQFFGVEHEKRGTPRKPESIVDAVKMGVPGLRQQVGVDEKKMDTAQMDKLKRLGREQGLEAAGKAFDKLVESGDVAESKWRGVQEAIELSKTERRIQHAPLLEAIKQFNALDPSKQTDVMKLAIANKLDRADESKVKGKDWPKVESAGLEFYKQHLQRVKELEAKQ